MISKFIAKVSNKNRFNQNLDYFLAVFYAVFYMYFEVKYVENDCSAAIQKAAEMFYFDSLYV